MKKKFKIIFAVVAVMAMLFVFAISSSAWTGSDPGRNGTADDDYWYIYDINSCNFYGYAFTNGSFSGLDIHLDYFGILNDGVIDKTNEQIANGSTPDLNLYHISGWTNPDRGSKNNRFTREEVKLAFEQEYAKFEALLEKEFTQSDLDNAVEEYKNSTEYKLELLEEVKKVTGGESYGVEVFFKDSTKVLGAPSTCEVMIPFAENKLLYFAYSHGERDALIVNCSLLREFCDLHNISSLSELSSFMKTEYFDIYTNLSEEDSYGIRDFFENYLGYSEVDEYSDLFLEALNYSEFTSDSLDAKYNEGVEAGKAEGKTEGYTEGFNAGIEHYKESDSYKNALEVQYSTGKTDGVTEFKKSVAFANSLKAEYDNGYDAGVADTEGQVVKNEFTKVLSIFIGVMAFGIILMSVLGVTSKFKKKKHR